MSAGALGYTVRRAALTVLVVAGLAIATMAAAATLGGQAVAGVAPDAESGSVLAVSTTGFAWRDGIRAGQTVVAVDDSLSPGGWRIATVDAAGASHESLEAGWDDALAGSWPLAAGALVAALLAIVFARTHRRWAIGSAALALFLASIPLDLQGDPTLSTVSMAAAAIVPGAWLGRRLGRWWLRGLAWVLLAATVLAWSQARLAGDPAYGALEWIRVTLAGYGTGLVILGSTLVPVMRSPATITRPPLSELLLAGAITGVGALLVFVVQLPPLVVVVVVALTLLALPRARRVASRRLEQWFLADVREHVALEASEAERARLAHELHDAPLQHLTSVIRRLEVVPDTQAEAEQLREVADQLREAATNLRPPVLDDLGLRAALEFLASRATTAELPVSVAMNDAGPFEDGRPPAEVELAVFRIAQEAVANALQHAEATQVRIEGTVRPHEVDVIVRDDGRGLARDGLRDAARRGRLGLASMRRRAEAVDADLSIDGSPGGTAVEVRWQR